MKALILFLTLTFLVHHETVAQDDFELEPYQTMLMTGKGPGQDGSINPYYGQDCYAIVENIGVGEFSIRIQRNGEIIRTLPVKKGELMKLRLLKDHRLYFDAEAKDKVKVRLDYEPIDE